jgi:curli production assembly/transport component CsgE
MIYPIKNLFARSKRAAIIICAAIIAFALFSPNFPANAQDTKNKNGELRVSGILIDRTMTPIGELFFQAFSCNWSPPEKASFESITITERFNPQWGSMIWITIDDQDAFEKLLINRNRDMDELAREISSSVEQYLLQREILRHYQQSKDLLGDGY